MNLRVLVVDDERPARMRLRELIEATPELALVGEAADGTHARVAMASLRPDLVFLDVQMPDGGGFDVIDAVGAANMPPVVFVTAFERYAVPAFDFDAVDYLLKPFDDARFAQCIQRARRRILDRSPADVPDVLVVRERASTRVVPIDTIEWVEAQDQYAVLHLEGGGDAWMRKSLRELEDTLGAHGFVRVHRSAIVKPSRITGFRPRSHGDFEIELCSGARVKASRTFRERVRAALGA